MDANGTRFQLLLGRDDWARCRTAADRPVADDLARSDSGIDADFSWDGERHELTLGLRAFIFRSAPGNRPVALAERRGAAVDRYGNLYWISPDGTEIVVRSAATGEATHFWGSLDLCNRPCDGDTRGGFDALPGATAARPVALAGLAVTTQHYLVAGTVDPPGLLVFDLQTGGEPRQLLWPPAVPFAPFDLAETQDGGVLVLDRLGCRAWQLDRTFAAIAHHATQPPLRADDFLSVGGGAAHPPRPQAITLDLAIPLAAVNPVAVAGLPDGSFLVLDSPSGASFSAVLRYADGRLAGSAVSTAKAAAFVVPDQGEPFRLLGHDFAYAESWSARDGELQDLLLVAGQDGDQAFAFQITRSGEQIDLHPLPELFPLRLFGGRALVVGSGPAAGFAFYDSEEVWVPLVAQRRVRFATAAVLTVPGLDGKQPGCVWHRLLLDARIPPGCAVEVESRASDDAALLPAVAWSAEPALLRRATGSELPWQTAERVAGIDTWELLFQRAQGRYLDLRLTLSGTSRSTPRLRALRAWYPRFSYLDHYLPAIYREDGASASFLDRFLANFEGLFTRIEDRIAAVELLLDVRSAPAEALDWLAGWFGVALDPAWDEPRRRLFLRHATDFFEWRGTVPGLAMALRLAFDDCADDSVFAVPQPANPAIHIVEAFRTRTVPAVVYGAAPAASPAQGLPLRVQQERWEPSQGASELARRYAAQAGQTYPAQAPNRQADPQGYTAWTAFSRQTLGFVPRATAADVEIWQEFLEGRYPTVAALNAAWRTAYADWSAVELPQVPPLNAAALADWLLFEGVVLPSRDAAHRFTIYLPQSTLTAADRDRRLDLARRIASLEKPAHTTFEVKLHWAFFRLGEARLGEDTIVDLGGRSPDFMAPFTLDRSALGSGYLAPDRSSRLSSPCPLPGGGCQPRSTAGGTR